jgi:1,4-dihydroxy-2-naphthoyl-CoA hydrolase
VSIWFSEQPTIERLNAMRSNSILDSLGIEFTQIGDDFIEATMPVDRRTIQPLGLLHGGASVVLAETLGSVASVHCIDISQYYCVGLDVNANHIRAMREGNVTGRVTPIHLGRTTHVWEIRIRDNRDRLVCLSRLTMAILPARD